MTMHDPAPSLEEIRQRLVAGDDGWFAERWRQGNYDFDLATIQILETANVRMEDSSGQIFEFAPLYLPVVIHTQERLTDLTLPAEALRDLLRGFMAEQDHVTIVTELASSSALARHAPVQMYRCVRALANQMEEGRALSGMIPFDRQDDIQAVFDGYSHHGHIVLPVLWRGGHRCVSHPQPTELMQQVSMLLRRHFAGQTIAEVTVMMGRPGFYRMLQPNRQILQALSYLTLLAKHCDFAKAELVFTALRTPYESAYEILVDDGYQADLVLPSWKLPEFDQALEAFSNRYERIFSIRNQPTWH